MELNTECKSGVITVELNSEETLEQAVYLISDAHFDSIASDRTVLKRHLDKALSEDALIILGGDWFDAMQGKFDPRRNLDELRPEYRCEKYFDVVVEDSAKFLEPYAKNIIAVTQGNHELAVRRNSNTDLVDRLVFHLRLAGSKAVTGGWKGWFRFLLRSHNRNGNIKLFYSHAGAGSVAPVTRGVIATNRQAVYEPDADVIWNGHSHTAYIVPIARERLSAKGKVFNDVGWFIRTPGYKRDWEFQDGFVAQKGLGPNPVGCAKLELQFGAHTYPQVNAYLEIVP